MKIEELDAYPLRDYSFSLRKTNSFFSIGTVLLTLFIFAIAIFINFQTVKHLWVQRKQLQISTMSSISQTSEMTSNLLCFTNDETSNGPPPTFQFLDLSFNPLYFPVVSEEWVKANKPHLAKQISSPFSCSNLQGHVFTEVHNSLYIRVFVRSSTMYIETITEAQMFSKSPSFWKILKGNYTRSIYERFRTINAVIQDSLFVNADPQTYSMIYNVELSYLSRGPLLLATNYTQIVLQLDVPIIAWGKPWNKYILMITRKDIGIILGVVISWVSILALIFSFVVSPIMDKSLILLQIQTLFHLQSTLQRPSLLKFMIACLKQGIFPKEDKYVKLCDRLQVLKDIGFTLRMKAILKKITPLSYKPINRKDIVACQHNFNQQKFNEFQAESFTEKRQANNSDKLDVLQQKQDNILSQVRKGLLCYLDAGSDLISIRYKGFGHRSKQSACISILFGVGFIIFLSLFGVFSTAKTTKLTNFKVDHYQYEFQAKNFIITSLSNRQMWLQLIDGNYNTIEKINLINSTDCLKGRTPYQISVIYILGPFVYCIDRDIKLVYSQNPSESVYLYVNTQKLLYPQEANLYYYASYTASFYFNPLIRRTNFDSTDGTYFFRSFIKITNLIDENQEVQIVPEMEVKTMQICTYRNLNGIVFMLSNTQTTIQAKVNTFFDILQNIWGFAIVCFTVLLRKFTKYINIRQKDKNLTTEKSEFRDNICILLSKINTLRTGRHKEELQRLKYYLKQQMRRKN